MADDFNPRKPKNSCDVNDRWNVPELATNAATSFGTSNHDIFARPNRNFTDQFQREIPICWDRASARFGNAALLAEKSPLSSKTRPLFQCTIAPSEVQSFGSIFLVGIGNLFLLSRRIRDLKADGTPFEYGSPKSEYHNTLYEVSFYLPEQGTIKFKVLVDKEGKITPALNEARQFLDKAVVANQPSSADFAIEPSAENSNQFVLKSGSIELTVNLEFAQEVTPTASDGTVSYYNQRVILAKSQPSSPLKIGNAAERARFVSPKKAGDVSVLQRQTLEMTKVRRTQTYPARDDIPERIVVFYSSPGKIYLIMLSDGRMAQIRKMDKGEVGQEDSFLYIPDHQTGEIKQIELRDTGKGLVAEGYDDGFKIEKQGTQFPFTLVNRKTIEPEKIDLLKELETLELEAKDDNFSRENQYINKFRRAVIATFIGNEHLLSGSNLLTQMQRKQAENLDTWRVRVIRALEDFGNRTNEFKGVGNGYSTQNAPKTFLKNELNPPQPKTKPGEAAPKPNLCSLLRTRLSDASIDRIPDPRSLIIKREGKTDLLKVKKELMSIDPSLTLQPQTAFADYEVREEVVEKVAKRFGIAIDSIWDLADPAHRGMSLDQITQTGNHFIYRRADTRLQIEFDRSSSGAHFADVANLRITYDGQLIPFEYTVEEGRPYLLLKSGLHGVVFYLSPTDRGNYAVTEATHPVIREQAERDMGYTPAPRPNNILYPEIRENFLSLISTEQSPDEQILTEQIYRNRLWKLKEAGVLPEDLKEQLLIAKRLEVYFIKSYSLLQTFEEMAEDEVLKEVLQKLVLKLGFTATVGELDSLYQTEKIKEIKKTKRALLLLQGLNREMDPEKASEPTPPANQTFVPERAVSEEPPPLTPPVCEAPDQAIEPLVSRQPPPNMLIRALLSLGETGQKLIDALFPSDPDAATQPILEDADVRDGFLGIARFFEIPDKLLTALLSPDSAETQTTEPAQASVTPLSTPEEEPELVCREPKQEDQSVPSDKVDEKAKSEDFNKAELLKELAKYRGDVSESFKPKHQENLAQAISYIKASGVTEVKDFVLAMEACIPTKDNQQQKVIWDFLGRILRYQFDYKEMSGHVLSALGTIIKETSERSEKLKELKRFNTRTEEEKREEEKRNNLEEVAP